MKRKKERARAPGLTQMHNAKSYLQSRSGLHPVRVLYFLLYRDNIILANSISNTKRVVTKNLKEHKIVCHL